jgi:hypothetical protein
MRKPVVDVFILVSLFAPLLSVVCAASDVVAAQASLLEMGGGWQALFLATLALPVFALRRLQLLKAPSQSPSLME